MRPQVAEAALPGRGGNSSRLTVGSRRAVPVSALLKASPRLPAAAVGPVGSLSCTSSPSILAEAPAYRVAAASWNQVSRPLWMVERIKPRLFPSPAAVPHTENRCSAVGPLLTPSCPAGEPLRRGPTRVPGADLSGGRRDHQGGQARFASSSAVMGDHGEQRPHMTWQHAPSDRVAELTVGDDLTVLCDLYQDGACCVGGLSQPRGESAHSVSHGEVVTDGDGERISHGVRIRVVQALHKLVRAAPHPEASSDQPAMRRRTRMNPPPRAMAATARTMPVMLAPVSGRRLSPVAAAAAAAWP